MVCKDISKRGSVVGYSIVKELTEVELKSHIEISFRYNRIKMNNEIKNIKYIASYLFLSL